MRFKSKVPPAINSSQRHWRNVHTVINRLNELQSRPRSQRLQKPSPIIPVIIGAETKAMKVAEQLRTNGIFIPAVRFPTVSRGQARTPPLRQRCAIPEEQLNQLHAAFQSIFDGSD